MATPDAHILYVDDEEHNLTAFRATFRRDFTVHTAISAHAATSVLAEHPIEVVVTDQRMPDVTGVEFLESIRSTYPDAIRIVLTGYADVEAIVDAINRGGVSRYVAKPWDENDLRMTLSSAIDTFRLRRKNAELLEHLARYNEELERTVAERTAELKRRSDELEASNRSIVEQNKQITRLNTEKSKFLALAGEDLRTPVRDILRTSSHAIERGAKLSSSDATDHFGTVRVLATRMQAVLDNLLMVNEIETTGVRVYATHVDPGMVAQMVVSTHQPHARDKGVQLHQERAGSMGMVHTDPTALQTIMDHLVSNAVKFTPSGGNVHVTTSMNGNNLVLTVEDSGPGFSAQDKDHLFEKFAVLSAKPTAGELSTGLGLNIAHNHVKALNGTIELTSESGQGARWTVQIPSL
jgi:signal transduction histidine kinase